jgi:topoisomerase IV subunit A
MSVADLITDKPLSAALSERYLAYALSTIMARSLPDVRDGLKPVHRRILFAMRQLRLASNEPARKSARVVGDVIGKYHPHGDQSVYDAMVRLAQDFAQRYPLVDGQGNFGNIDGDNAAAMRYTEARLTAIAELMMEGLDEDAVDFRLTYDESGNEPVVMPAGFPNLLANGSAGIAVGMATSIPPHNVPELCDALRHLIAHPNSSIEKLVSYVQGPDFPTGGVLVEPRESILEAYKTGQGGFRVRARWEKEELKGGGWQIVVTEIPYQVQKSRLIEKIAELLQAKKLPLLDDVVDESAEDVRLVLVPKSRNVDPALMMESLFRASDLESRFSLNMNVLDATNTPRVMNLREALQGWLDHRQVVLERRARHRLDKIENRLEVLGGYLIAYLNLDEVIRIIRTEDEPKPVLMKKFSLTENQAEAILNMRLRALRKLEEMEIKREDKALRSERTELKALLADPAKRWAKIDDEIKAIKEKFGSRTPLGKRRSSFAEAPAIADVPVDAFIEREPITVLLSEKLFIRAAKGHIDDVSDMKHKEGDRENFAVKCETTDKLLAFGTNGRFYTIACNNLPSARGFGDPLRLSIELGEDADIIALFKYEPGKEYIVASSDGRGFRVKADDVLAQTKNGKVVLNVETPEEARAICEVRGDYVAVIGENRKLLIFKLAELPEMSRGKGITLQKYKDGGLSDVTTLNLKEGLSWKSGAGTRTETAIKEWVGERAQAGRLPPQGFARSNKFGG